MINTNNSSIYKKRRQEFCNNMKNNSFAIFSSGSSQLLPINDKFSYRTHVEYFYLTGLDYPIGTYIITKSTIGIFEEYLFLDPIDPDLERWDGKMLTFSLAKKISGIDIVKSSNNLISTINKIAKYLDILYIQSSQSFLGTSKSDYEHLIYNIRSHFPALNIKNSSSIINKMRWVKDKHEIELIKKAVSITDKLFRNISDHFKVGFYEYQIEAAITYQYRFNGSQYHAFYPIVASGKNSTVLHYSSANCKLKPNCVLLIDTGARWKMYNSDITRVFPIGGRFTSFASDMYDLNLTIQKKVLKTIKSGQTLRDIFANTTEIQKKLLLENKIIKKPEDYKKYTIHNLGHSLGLDVHDPFDIDIPLQEGSVITVEPGLYFPNKEVGIRIEDDVLIKKNNIEILSSNIPKEINSIYTLLNV